MTSQERARTLEAMRRATVEQSYVFTPHALLEMRADRLDVVDVESTNLIGTMKDR